MTISLPAPPRLDGLAAGVAAQTRRRMSAALRDRLAGDEKQSRDRVAEIMSAGERPFGPQDPVWRVHADASGFVGGIRALLLQSLHPLAMAGVAGHSGYKADPWGRLQRTSHYIAATTFGTYDVAAAAVAQVRAIHERVRGKAPDGRPYSASDPHLLAWVHATELDSFLTAYRRHGVGTLTRAEEDTYVRQVGRSAHALGVLHPPQSVAEMESTLEAFRPELTGQGQAREAARFLLFQPPVSGLTAAGYGALAAGAVALLPVWAKQMLRLPALPVTERLVSGPGADAVLGAMRWAMTDPENGRPLRTP